MLISEKVEWWHTLKYPDTYYIQKSDKYMEYNLLEHATLMK